MKKRELKPFYEVAISVLLGGLDHEFCDLGIGSRDGFSGQITVICLLGQKIIDEKYCQEVAEALLSFWGQAPEEIVFEEPTAMTAIKALQVMKQISLLPEVPEDENVGAGEPLVYLARLARDMSQ